MARRRPGVGLKSGRRTSAHQEPRHFERQLGRSHETEGVLTGLSWRVLPQHELNKAKTFPLNKEAEKFGAPKRYFESSL